MTVCQTPCPAVLRRAVVRVAAASLQVDREFKEVQIDDRFFWIGGLEEGSSWGWVVGPETPTPENWHDVHKVFTERLQTTGTGIASLTTIRIVMYCT
eukprot:1149866-Pelagomonas_calceolata.AAC.2